MSGPNNHSYKLNGNFINENCIVTSSGNKSQQNPHLKAHQQGQKQVAKQQSSTTNSQPINQQTATNGHTQIQTLATVHHSSAAVPQLTSNQHIHQQQQRLSKGGVGNEPAHTIPPRYQPPPQPSSGILKHLSGGKSTYYPTTSLDLNSHFNIKYPPDIPKLSSVYVPDSIKAQGNPSRFIQQRPIPQHRGQLLISTSQDQDNILRLQQQQQEMLKFVRKSDQDSNTQGVTPTGIPSTVRLSSEPSRQLQPLITELRALKEANQRLVDDNQELRDLCCFLDDDRQKGRKLAREWQRFGRYTASVMRQEVSAYQTKLRQLDDKQQELITDNLELKELCLYLDEERAHIATNSICANCSTPVRGTLRDDGDGSSSSTNAEETISALRSYERQYPDVHLSSTLNDQTLQYVRSLERRIQQLEEERMSGSENVSQRTPEPIPGRPEAVIRALQVLEVREQLERDRFGNLTGMPIEHMDDGEKAIVREMCNVVWRKLESSTNDPSMEE
ncbi:coiled-coil domain-containing protein 85C [Episyrphus balteatus]|uniref:coiled-coil domain-containing protein 85C n=1 Tax=Episyrphus balteatus TaxID=286459 RepID=UPI0024861256|nr:coiled-coil domain-containing protein 85C [Episyrphus balteatus]XP_055849358.1 coiled-coil domain-containing protein 85C [Episyrphus balteatus]XP_055849368.1 coiled-coil domain-containing protein 85C [Episyrphus balteatus]